MNLQKIAYFFISAIGFIAALSYGKTLILPFILGLLVWYIMRGAKASLDKIPFIKKNFSSWLKGLVAASTIIGILVVVFHVISDNIAMLSASYEKYELNVEEIIKQLNVQFNLNIVEILKKQTGDFDFGNILRAVFSSITELISNAFLIMLYSIFILLEETYIGTKLKRLFSKEAQYLQFSKTLAKIDDSISSYFKLKTLVSLLTGSLSFLALWLIGIDSPAFWAFLIFILNFIPTIGSLIGTLFPAAFCLLQFGEVFPCFLVLGVVGTIQVIVGNGIEPKIVGSSMNISPLVAILGLSLWGMIWGVIGMVLTIPITVVAIIVFSQFEKTRGIAIMLSEKGEID